MRIRDVVSKVISLINCNVNLMNIEITGTIINLKSCPTYGRSGMTYLTISDGDEVNDKIDAIIYTTDTKINNNSIIKCHGRMQLYVNQRDSRKQLQYHIQTYEICGISGDSSYTKLKQKLLDDNVITNIYKTIPKFPKKIGIIGGTKNDGTFDVLNKLRDKYFGDVYVYDTVLTPVNIIERINYANNQNICEVLMIVRGGGSKDDIATLNDYDLAVTVKQSKIPIISGIGHTLDHTIVDDVADHYCETPTSTAYFINGKYEIYSTDQKILRFRYNEITSKIKSLIESMYDKISIIDNIYGSMIDKYISKYNSITNNIHHTIKSNKNLCDTYISQEHQKINNSITYNTKLYRSIIINIADILNEKYNCIQNTSRLCNLSYTEKIQDMISKYSQLEIMMTTSLTHIFSVISPFNIKVSSNGTQILTALDAKQLSANKQLVLKFFDGDVVVERRNDSVEPGLHQVERRNDSVEPGLHQVEIKK